MAQQIHVRLPDDLYTWLTNHSKRTRQPINALITHIIEGAQHAMGKTPGEVVLDDLEYWIEEGDYEMSVGECVEQRLWDVLCLIPEDQRGELHEKYAWLHDADHPCKAIQEHRDEQTRR